MHEHSMVRVYVWEAPVRMYHWVNAIAIVVLIATGLIIGNPPSFTQSAEASYGYWFGITRFIHFIAAFVFFFNFIFRLYWSMVGNEHARWYNFIPLTPKLFKQQVKGVLDVLRVDILQARIEPLESVGHNAAAAWSYFGTFLAFLFQSITGFALYSGMSESFLPKLFTWIVPLMGGDMAVRQWHHIFTWIFVLFTMVHVYLVWYHDWVEGRGEVSSMVGGWKFIEKHVYKK